jgi:hypothetical protein
MSCGNKETYQGYNFQKLQKECMDYFTIDLTLDKLKTKLTKEADGGVHYTVSSIVPSNKSDSFIQTGCGPNFMGCVLTQGTCRHDIRSKYYSRDEWKNKWLAGFTAHGREKCGASYLFYLMKVQKTCNSFRELYEYYKENDDTLIEAKRADKNPCGDLYIPKKDNDGDEWDLYFYEKLHSDHSHNKKNRDWRDINYPFWLYAKNKYEEEEKWPQKFYSKWKKGKKVEKLKHANLLVANQNHSYLWFKPMLRYKGGEAPRHQKYDNINELINILEPVSEIQLPKFNKKNKRNTC